MTKYTAAALSLVLCVLPMMTGLAQSCAGAASFASGPVRIGGSIEVGADAKQYSGQIGFGRAAGPFAAGTVGIVDLDETDDSGTLFAGELGYSLPMSAAGKFEICPIIGLGRVTVDLSEGGVSADLSSRLLSAGLSFGGVMASTPTFALVPAVALIYTNEKLKSEGVIEFEESDDYGIVTLAVGLVFNQAVTLRPNIAFPVGLDDSDPAYGLGIGFNFGTPSGR